MLPVRHRVKWRNLSRFPLGIKLSCGLACRPQLFYFKKFLFLCRNGLKNRDVSNQEKFLKGVNLKEAGAWKELYRFFYGALCNYATGIVSDDSIAEDIVQECLISVWKSELVFTEVKALSVYLYRAVYNNSLKYLRDKKTNDRRLSRWNSEQDETEEIFFYQAVEEEMIRKLRVAISKLPEQRQNILLLSSDGYSVQEIADRLGISVNTVKTQKKRAYVYLKEQLKDSYVLLFWLELLEKK